MLARHLLTGALVPGQCGQGQYGWVRGYVLVDQAEPFQADLTGLQAVALSFLIVKLHPSVRLTTYPGEPVIITICSH